MVRDGNYVLRPATIHTSGVHALLRHVRAEGFDGAPLPVGIDPEGRERLELVDGDVPLVPYPTWSQTTVALGSIARLLRQFHDAASAFDPTEHTWSRALADPAGGPIVCHNDLEPSNIVFSKGVAVAFIDFEFAAPGRPLFDLAQLARLCVPIEHEIDCTRMGWHVSDQPARLRLIADSYGLTADDRHKLPEVIDEALDRVEQSARAALASADTSVRAAIARTGGIEKYDRRRQWWTRHRPAFSEALR